MSATASPAGSWDTRPCWRRSKSIWASLGRHHGRRPVYPAADLLHRRMRPGARHHGGRATSTGLSRRTDSRTYWAGTHEGQHGKAAHGRNAADGKALSLAEYEKDGRLRSAQKVLRQMTPKEVQEVVKAANLRGRGGAGFPTGVKWGFTPIGERRAASQVPHLQLGRDGAGGLQGPGAHGRQPPPVDRGDDHSRLRNRGGHRLHLFAVGLRRDPAAGSRPPSGRHTRRATWARPSQARATPGNARPRERRPLYLRRRDGLSQRPRREAGYPEGQAPLPRH